MDGDIEGEPQLFIQGKGLSADHGDGSIVPGRIHLLRRPLPRSIVNAADGAEDGGGAHPYVQPYITVFMWKRTA